MEGEGVSKYTLMLYRPCTWSPPPSQLVSFFLIDFELLNRNHDLPNVISPNATNNIMLNIIGLYCGQLCLHNYILIDDNIFFEIFNMTDVNIKI